MTNLVVKRVTGVVQSLFGDMYQAIKVVLGANCAVSALLCLALIHRAFVNPYGEVRTGAPKLGVCQDSLGCC